MNSLEQLCMRFQGLYSGAIYDAMQFDLKFDRPFVVSTAIKPAWRLPVKSVLFGHAFTCRGQIVRHENEIDDTVRIRMFTDFSPGCVQVIDSGGDRSVAHFGDISGKIARKFGCQGAVIDGNTRDVRILEEDQFLVFCRDIQPVDAYGRWQIVDYQVDIWLTGLEGRIRVTPGDYIFGDADGVLVIPKAAVQDVCEQAERRCEREAHIRRQLLETDDIQHLYSVIGRW